MGFAHWYVFGERVAPLSIITLPQKRESEANVYFPFGGNWDTERGPPVVGGSADDRRKADGQRIRDCAIPDRASTG